MHPDTDHLPDLAKPRLPSGEARPGRCAAALAGLIALGLIGGCSELTDDLDPARLFGGDKAAPAPGADQEFPNLATVPDKPRPASTPAEIKQVAEGLAADREHARYTDRELRNSAVDEVDFPSASKAATTDANHPLSAGASASADEEAAALEKKARERAAAATAAKPAVPKQQPKQESKAEAAPAAVPAPAPPVETQKLEAPAEAAQQAVATAPSATLAFAPGSAELGGEARERLHDLAASFARLGGTLRVIGHAPQAAGTETVGGALAYDRALVVGAELERLGVPQERMRVVAGKPGADAGDDRVDVVIER